MFEDSLMESEARLSSPIQRWTTIASIALQTSVVAIVFTIPLLHPETLPFHIDAPRVILPPKPLPQPIQHVQESSAASSPASPSANVTATRPTIFPTQNPETVGETPVTNLVSGTMSDTNLLPSVLGAKTGSETHVSIAPRPSPASLLHVSTGVSQGLLVSPIRPIYPHIAVLARVEGVVVVEAVISKSGAIERARVTSGPEMLRGAAIDAVRNARYSPYMLNGTPTEVETTIRVNFRLAN